MMHSSVVNTPARCEVPVTERSAEIKQEYKKPQ
jgi:hypothetical protein